MNKKGKIIIENTSQIEEILTDKNITFYQLHEFINEEVEIDDKFNVSKEYEGIHPHTLLKPTQSALDLQAICFETGDNSIDAGCKELFYQFLTNTDGSITTIIYDDGNGILNHDIKNAVAYGGYFGPKDINKSGKFLEGLSNACGSFAGLIEINTNNGDGWYKSVVRFDKLKYMIKVYEDEVYKLKGIKKDLYRGLAYKYIAQSYIDDPIKIDANNFRGFLNKDKGTIIVFRNCYVDIVDSNSLDEDIKSLKEALGRRYWKRIDNGIKISVAKDYDMEIVKSIDFMLRSETCNYRGAFTTKFFKLEKMFKVSDFTGKDEDDDYIPLYVSIKEKTKLYAEIIPKRHKKTDLNKVVVPEILIIGLEHQGLSVERNNIPIIDNAKCGLKKHPNYNGISVEICVDSRMDDALFVTGDKSGLSQKKLNRVFGKKLYNILSQAYKVKKNGGAISYTNADGEIVEVYSTIIKAKHLMEEDPEKDSNESSSKSDSSEANTPQNSSKKPQQGNNLELNSQCRSSNSNTWISGLVFAATDKSICRYDADTNTMLYKRNDDKYLIYDRPIDYREGLRIKHLQKWWFDNGSGDTTLEERIKLPMQDKKYQMRVFNIYKNKIEGVLKENTPALLVEIELYHNSYIFKADKNNEPQRFDFCLVFPKNKKVLVEIDGIQHIGDENPDGTWRASEEKYALQCKFDAEWTLKGNEIYRISNKLLRDMNKEDGDLYLENFFVSLLKKYNIIS